MQTTLNSMSPLPVSTWNWLSINHTNLTFEGQAIAYQGTPVVTRPKDVSIFDEVTPQMAPVPAILAETGGFVENHANHKCAIHIPAGVQVEEPIQLSYQLNDGGNWLCNRIHIIAGPNSRAAITICYENAGQIPAFHSGYLSIEAGEGARLDLTMVQLLGSKDVHTDAIQVTAARDADVRLLLGELGAAQVVSGADVALLGERARARIDSLYAAHGNERRDLNYRMVFSGAQTTGEIVARGVLHGQAKKTFKSTIDFQTGAVGAKGREEESVLVLSDQVRNLSTPLLLCGEDHVEGQHATNIGRPDPGKLYYLMSRGISERQAKKVLVEAALNPMLEQVLQEDLREAIITRIQEVVQDEG